MAKLVYVMGASGSGKDSLLDALRNITPLGLLVAHRYITRPAHAGAENHIALSLDEFQQRKAHRLFALDWQAHQTHYALGVEIDLWMQRGFTVVVNGSRAHLAEAVARYGAALLPVYLHVSGEVLAERLALRGRETPLEIQQRLQRAAEYQHGLPAECRRLNNDGRLQDTLADLLTLLTEQAVCTFPPPEHPIVCAQDNAL
ncbi:ribose 1,5-bisphosphokinase [Rouxiella badensis]|jgi:ribose 1,5-bisphosphokinase|uniref:Ribose 1,5-bisphosphate phosphokinase PhnN n=1 Tax=Rouxiella badensis TaxID=1646377 RepID=A0A1X0WBG1_9GAMM|nr:ribose 1,5-bisphosphokinase [Rouxiella badensis]ORJ24104.1 ribose 1,5-bisphosphokinase [Rouxiella badensis]QII36347.1 ribose 1,5-bisphosphokinase [Rouxiella badensis]WAT05919.1 ribose 1,5-bisphosphokinase [Rouxiella badensis]